MMTILLTACGFFSGETPKESSVMCTDIAMSSVNVTVQDPTGGVLSGATVTWSVDGSESVACEDMGGSYVCGWEQAGEFAITASADGFLTGTTTVTVEQTPDGCHVVSEQVTLTLEPDAPDCTDNIVHSLHVHVTTDAAIPIENETVMWGLANADMAPEPCTMDQDHFWWCAEEVSGDLDIYVSAPNFLDAYQVVSVAMDADQCHVVTEEVEVSLTPG